MIRPRPVYSLGMSVVGARRRVAVSIPRLQPTCVPLLTSSKASQDKGETGDDLSHLDEEYSKLKVNWFPGHMVKATRIIREKLKQVDMVFEVRDARIPFSSANKDLDRLVGPRKARLIILNKADLANQALEQRVLQRFKDEGKDAIYACGLPGANVKKILAWARQRGAKRGEFHTTGAVAMVVGMPNVGKSSLINLLLARGKALRGDPSVNGKGAAKVETGQQVANVGAMPGVTRQVSAFRIALNPPLYLVDTPGVMVPRVDSATKGFRLALTRAVPDTAVPLDILVAFMLKLVRLRRVLGTRREESGGVQRRHSPACAAQASSSNISSRGMKSETEGGDPVGRRRSEREGQQARGVSRAVEAWLSRAVGVVARPPRIRGGIDTGDSHHDDGDGLEALLSREGGVAFRDPRPVCGNDDQWENDRGDDDDMEALLMAVERESGAEGKPDAEVRRICSRYLLEAFREGQFGRITLDGVPRQKTSGAHRQRNAEISSSVEDNYSRAVQSSAGTNPVSTEPGGRKELSAEVLGRVDWSSASAWERADTRKGQS